MASVIGLSIICAQAPNKADPQGLEVAAKGLMQILEHGGSMHSVAISLLGDSFDLWKANIPDHLMVMQRLFDLAITDRYDTVQVCGAGPGVWEGGATVGAVWGVAGAGPGVWEGGASVGAVWGVAGAGPGVWEGGATVGAVWGRVLERGHAYGRVRSATCTARSTWSRGSVSTLSRVCPLRTRGASTALLVCSRRMAW